MTSRARIKPFSVETRLAKLRARHQELKARINQERQRPAPCSISLQTLKRKRLIIKDEIARFDGLLRTIGASRAPHVSA
ncbi:YdcH family protein [Sulfitobacter sp. D35]|uniref:YdcH family protein n=1 Tax=Sulfitobacter sp. D35 TaxID=3083252 RepID=UPI00296F8C06|nr:YdcH family protein [Sulfitobacter sp. D35]MDW4497151.1 YdcH family protein [Sulfitobacter sp. D35]